MARKSAKRTGTNAGATERKFDIGTLTAGPHNPGIHVDGAHCLSLGNHRLYRSARTYRMRVSLTNPNAATTSFPIFALRNNWGMRKAIETAHRVWKMSVEDEMELVKPSRWYDFRIGFSLGSGPTLVPSYTPVVIKSQGAGYAQLDDGTGEKVGTQISTGTGTMKGLILGNSSSGSNYNILEEFSKMGAPEQSTAVNLAGGYEDAANYEVQAGSMADLLDDGNLPPYNLQFDFDKIWVKVGEIGLNATGDSVTMTQYFDAPLGWVFIPSVTAPQYQASDTSCTGTCISVEFQAGDYKGVSSDAIVGE